MARTARAPDGEQWQVAIEWEAAHLRRLSDRAVHRIAWFLRRRDRWSAERAERAVRAKQQAKKGRWYDYLDLPMDELVVVVVPAVIAIILIVWFGPILIALLFGLVDVTLVVVGVLVLGCWRIAARRPWAIVASCSDGAVVQWSVVGVRRARQFVASVADQIENGAAPAQIQPEQRLAPLATRGSVDQADLPGPELAARSWAEALKSIGAVLAAVAIVIGLWLWLRPAGEPTVQLRAPTVSMPKRPGA